MTTDEIIDILKVAGRLKTNTRHCYTDTNRKESVAEHSWRVALWGMLITWIPEFSDLNVNKVIRMAIIHDLGEAFTGDIPSFEKTPKDVDKEKVLFTQWVNGFSEPIRTEWLNLISEMEAMQTREACVYKALDKMEAVLSHDESDINSWLPLEFNLQMEYGWNNVLFSVFLTDFRKKLDLLTQDKIKDFKNTNNGMDALDGTQNEE